MAKKQRKNKIYDRVLTFPKNPAYIKFFEETPHPDRFDDRTLSHAELFSKQDLNTNKYQLICDFLFVKNYLKPELSDLDKKILKMPSIFQDMADEESDESYKIAFKHLSNCFYNYFSSPTKGDIIPEPMWIDKKVIANYYPTLEAINDLRMNLFNTAAKNNLVDKLKKINAFRDERADFYFWNTDPRNWSEVSYQARVSSIRNCSAIYSFTKANLPAAYWALGDHTVNAIPEGYVKPL